MTERPTRMFRVYLPRNFTNLPNHVAVDPRISFAAKGLLWHLVSRPEDWECRKTSLYEVGPDGRRAVDSAVEELKASGYVRTSEDRDGRGRKRVLVEATVVATVFDVARMSRIMAGEEPWPKGLSPAELAAAHGAEKPLAPPAPMDETHVGHGAETPLDPPIPMDETSHKKGLSSTKNGSTKNDGPSASPPAPPTPDEREAATLLAALPFNAKRRALPDDPPGFSLWWAHYPGEGVRLDAVKAWRAARKRGATATELAQATVNYVEDCRLADRFLRHGSSFLASDRWREWGADWTPPARPAKGARPIDATTATALDALAAIRARNGTAPSAHPDAITVTATERTPA